MKFFWHRLDGTWHCYRSSRGESLCDRFMFGVGMPADARPEKGRGKYCASCNKARKRIAGWERERKKRERVKDSPGRI